MLIAKKLKLSLFVFVSLFCYVQSANAGCWIPLFCGAGPEFQTAEPEPEPEPEPAIIINATSRFDTSNIGGFDAEPNMSGMWEAGSGRPLRSGVKTGNIALYGSSGHINYRILTSFPGSTYRMIGSCSASVYLSGASRSAVTHFENYDIESKTYNTPPTSFFVSAALISSYRKFMTNNFIPQESHNMTRIILTASPGHFSFLRIDDVNFSCRGK